MQSMTVGRWIIFQKTNCTCCQNPAKPHHPLSKKPYIVLYYKRNVFKSPKPAFLKGFFRMIFVCSFWL